MREAMSRRLRIPYGAADNAPEGDAYGIVLASLHRRGTRREFSLAKALLAGTCEETGLACDVLAQLGTRAR